MLSSRPPAIACLRSARYWLKRSWAMKACWSRSMAIRYIPVWAGKAAAIRIPNVWGTTIVAVLATWVRLARKFGGVGEKPVGGVLAITGIKGGGNAARRA